jgi:phage-related baseplate assembly protein
MSRFNSIDLSQLPGPDVIQTTDVDALLAEMKAVAVAWHPELAPFLELESETATKILRVCAYVRTLDRLAFNDGVRANMLALAGGADLDQLVAFWGVARLIVQEADDTVSPPIEEIKESDDALRTRAQLSLEGHSTAGARGAYQFWALTADGKVKDASVASPEAGQVVVTVLSHEGNGAPSAELLSAVESTLNAEDVRPLTDLVTVQAAAVVPFQIEATLTLFPGPGGATVEAAALDALDEYLAARHHIGHDITVSGIHAALHQPGVQNVVLTQPANDLAIDETQAAFCDASAVAVTIGGRNV